jgi:DNA-binding response OmpR family regulator
LWGLLAARTNGKGSVMFSPIDPAVTDAPPVPTALVCDDDEDIRALVGVILEGHGFTVRHAADVASAIVALDEGGVDIAVSDIGLPDGSGVDVCRHASELGCRVVAMTATVGPDLAAALASCSAVVLHKPFSLNELLAAVVP